MAKKAPQKKAPVNKSAKKTAPPQAVPKLVSAKKPAASKVVQPVKKTDKKVGGNSNFIESATKSTRRAALKSATKTAAKPKMVTHESTPSPVQNRNRDDSSEIKKFTKLGKLSPHSERTSGSKAENTTRPNNDKLSSNKQFEENSAEKNSNTQKNLLKNATKQQFSGKIDTVSITESLSKMIKNIEQKRQSSKSTDKKRIDKSVHDKKFTAKSHNYELQKNPKMKHTPLINLFDLSKKHEFTNSDVILALIEIALNSDCYSIPKYSGKSNNFWEEVVQYNELKRLFQFYRPETIKKYWRLINYKNNSENAAKIVKQNKRLIDEQNPKLLTIISGIQNLLAGSITNFSDFILNHYKYINIGLPSEKEAKLTGKKREKEIEKVFKGENVTEEVKKFLAKEGFNSQSMLLEEKDEIKKLSYGLRTINSRENKRLFKFTEEDKFVFSCIDKIVDTLSKEVKDATREFIINALKVNTLKLPQIFEYLKKPHQPTIEKAIFNSGDDHVIKYMKDSTFYKELIDIHGKPAVEDREYFLS